MTKETITVTSSDDYYFDRQVNKLINEGWVASSVTTCGWGEWKVEMTREIDASL